MVLVTTRIIGGLLLPMNANVSLALKASIVKMVGTVKLVICG